jgi:hypothetical protein
LFDANDIGKTFMVLNADVMSRNANKIGASRWLLERIGVERAAENQPPLKAVIVSGDSGNDKDNMDAAAYRAMGLEPAFTIPGNAHPTLAGFIDEQRKKKIITYQAPALTVTNKELPEFYSQENYGLGGTLQGIQSVIKQLSLTKFISDVENTIDGLNLVGDEKAAKTALKEHPYLTEQKEILAALQLGEKAEDVEKMVKAATENRANNIASFKQKLTWASTSFKDIDAIVADADRRDVTAINAKTADVVITSPQMAGRVEAAAQRASGF